MMVVPILERLLILKRSCSLAPEFFDVLVAKDIFKLESFALSKCLFKLLFLKKKKH